MLDADVRDGKLLDVVTRSGDEMLPHNRGMREKGYKIQMLVASNGRNHYQSREGLGYWADNESC